MPTVRALLELYEFDPGRRISRVMLVGAGGTGAQIARLLARLLYDMRQRALSIPEFHIYDPDHVETRNIGRQLFAAGDIGHNKAHITARRLNLALGLQVTAQPVAFTSESQIANNSYAAPSTLVIGAVDNAAARAAIAAKLNECVAWIDCGNHESGGQVVIGNGIYTDPSVYRPTEQNVYPLLPAPHILFPELITPDPEPLSCADLAAQNRQALFVNDWMALAAIDYAQSLLLRRPLTHHITYIDTLSSQVRSIPISPTNLHQLLKNNAQQPHQPKGDPQ